MLSGDAPASPALMGGHADTMVRVSVKKPMPPRP